MHNARKLKNINISNIKHFMQLYRVEWRLDKREIVWNQQGGVFSHNLNIIQFVRVLV